MTPHETNTTTARRDLLISLAQPPAASMWLDWSRWAGGRGRRLHRADSSSDVIRTVESQNILLALLDEDLPGVSGLSMVRIVRAIEPRVHCVLVAHRPTRRLMQEALDRGAFSVLAPPLGIDVFADLLGRIGQRAAAG